MKRLVTTKSGEWKKVQYYYQLVKGNFKIRVYPQNDDSYCVALSNGCNVMTVGTYTAKSLEQGLNKSLALVKKYFAPLTK